MVVGGLVVLSNLSVIISVVVDGLSGAAQPRSSSPGAPPTRGAPAAKLPSTGRSAATSKGTANSRPKSTTNKAAPAKVAAPRPLGPPDCANASAAEIKAIIHRSVQPVVTRQGCAWGTRLDDQSTVLVTIVMTPDHSAFDTNLTTSVAQKRVVFGSSYDTSYRPATQASVATGQPIVRGTKSVRARADTVVVVATTKLGVTDDRAREMAVRIAAAANG